MQNYYKQKFQEEKKISELMTAVDVKNTLCHWWEIRKVRPFRVNYTPIPNHMNAYGQEPQQSVI